MKALLLLLTVCLGFSQVSFAKTFFSNEGTMKIDLVDLRDGRTPVLEIPFLIRFEWSPVDGTGEMGHCKIKIGSMDFEDCRGLDHNNGNYFLKFDWSLAHSPIFYMENSQIPPELLAKLKEIFDNPVASSDEVLEIISVQPSAMASFIENPGVYERFIEVNIGLVGAKAL